MRLIASYAKLIRTAAIRLMFIGTGPRARRHLANSERCGKVGDQLLGEDADEVPGGAFGKLLS